MTLTNTFGGKTIASDSYGIDLTGTFRTAAFGGDKLEVGAAPAITNVPGFDR